MTNCFGVSKCPPNRGNGDKPGAGGHTEFALQNSLFPKGRGIQLATVGYPELFPRSSSYRALWLRAQPQEFRLTYGPAVAGLGSKRYGPCAMDLTPSSLVPRQKQKLAASIKPPTPLMGGDDTRKTANGGSRGSSHRPSGLTS